MPNDSTALQQLLTFLEDLQASNITVLDVHEQTTITDYMIICTGRSSRHVRSIAQHALEQMKAEGMPALSHSGFENGEWALVDFGDFIVHIMQQEYRDFYNLEGLWEA